MEAPEFSVSGNDYIFDWEVYCVRFAASRIKGFGDETTAQIKAESYLPGNSGHLYRSTVRLCSASSKESFLRGIRKSQAKPAGALDCPWEQMLESVCELTLEGLREREPEQIVPDDLTAAAAPIEFTVKPLLPKGQPSILFAEGGSGKSIFSCFLAVLTQSGFQPTGGGLGITQANVLYADWENQKASNWRRIAAICKGLEIKPPPIVYQSFHHPLSDEIDRLQELVAKHQIGLAIVDSFGYACSGETETSAPVLSFFRLINSLSCTALITDHIAKNQDSGKITAYGSTYKGNSARAVWHLMKSEENYEEGEMKIALKSVKFNDLPYVRPFGYEISFLRPEGAEIYQYETIYFKRLDVGNVADLRVKALSKTALVEKVLSDGRPRTVLELAEETDISENHLRVILGRHQDRFLNLTSHEGRQGNSWVLRSRTAG